MTDKIRIVFLVYRLHTGGAERQLLALAGGLDRATFDVRIVSLHGGGDLAPEAELQDIPHHSLDKASRRGNFRAIMRLWALFRTIDPDVVYSFTDLPNVLNQIVRLLGQRYATIWGLRSSDNNLADRDLVWRSVLCVSSVLSRLTTLMISNSHAGQAYYTSLGYRGKGIEIIANGIDTERFCPRPNARKDLRSELGLEGKVVIGFLGRITPKKDAMMFVRAATRAAVENDSLAFVVAGEAVGQYAQEVCKAASPLIASGRLHWLGLRTDAAAVLNALDVFSLTSRYGEGMPNSLAEAMACGLPCTTTDVGDSADVLGSEYWMIRKGDIDGQVRLWLDMAGRTAAERARIGTENLQRIRERYALKRMIVKSGEAISRVARKGSH